MRFAASDGKKMIFVTHLDKLDQAAAGADQYELRKSTVQLSEESLIPETLTKAYSGYTNTSREYYIPTTIKQGLWHSFAFTKWCSNKGERYTWMK
jgi:hypothetical protein